MDTTPTNNNLSRETTMPLTAISETQHQTNTASPRRITVVLPVMPATIDLPPALAETLQLIINAGSAGISSIELREQCIESVSIPDNIARLKELGILLISESRTVQHRGRKRTGIAHYIFDGIGQLSVH